jgi:WD40 repeat protein
MVFLPGAYMVLDRWGPWVAVHTFHGVPIAFSDDSKYLLTADVPKYRRLHPGEVHWVEVHQVRSGKLVIKIDTGNGPNAESISPDGTAVAAGHGDDSITLWSLSTLQPEFTLHHSKNVVCSAFSDDSRKLITVCKDGSARIWESRTGKELAVLKGSEGTILGAYFSKDSKRVMTMENQLQTDPIVHKQRIWDTETGELLREWNPDVPDNDITHRSDYEDFHREPKWPGVLNELGPFKKFDDPIGTAFVSPSGEFIVADFHSYTAILKHARPAYWWGHFYRPEVWIAAISGFLLTRSIRRARKLLLSHSSPST